MYWFTDSSKNILYVGKAKNLHHRLQNYKQSERLSSRIREMTTLATSIHWQILSSELEALLVEAELINLHQPPFNVLLKDDKSFLYIVITKETWPRVLKMRRRDLIDNSSKFKAVFGPFQSGYKVNQVLKLARKIFPWCNAPRPKNSARCDISKRACFYRHLGLCPGVCEHQISQAEYQQIISDLILFLRGKHRFVLQTLRQQMKNASQKQKYELAARLRDQIQAVTEITQDTTRSASRLEQHGLYLPRLYGDQISAEGLVHLKQILHNYLGWPQNLPLTRIEGYDVSNTSGSNSVVSMVVFTNGFPDKNQYRIFNIKTISGANDFGSMAEVLGRRGRHLGDSRWPQPDLILIDGGRGQVRAALTALYASHPQWHQTPLIGLEKSPDRLVLPIFRDSLPDIISSHTRLSLDWKIIKLAPSHPTLKLLQQIRDEAHRFAKKNHDRRRRQAVFTP